MLQDWNIVLILDSRIKTKSHVAYNMTTGPGRAEIPLGVICRKAYRGLNIQHLSGFIQSMVEVLAEIPFYRFA